MKKLLLMTISIMLLASVAWGQHQMGTISGTVLGQQEGGNVPLRYAHVVAFQGNSEWPMGMANTDSLGQYTLRVPFGQYVVAAGAMQYGRLWYNNVPERAQATVLTVADGQNPTGIDFLLVPQEPPPPPPGEGTISGNVMGQLDSSTVPLPATVLAYHPDGDHPVAMAMTDRSGNYTLHVNFGDYQVQAMSMHFAPLWYNNVPERAQATTLTVGDSSNPTGINFLLPEVEPPPPPQHGTIAGVVMGQQDGGPVPLRHANVMAFMPNRDWPVAETMTDSMGNYILRVDVGGYQVRAEARGFTHLWYNNVPDRSQATIVAVTDSTNPTGIDFLLPAVEPPPPPPPPLSGIAGTVTDAATNLPIAGAMVSAVKADNHWVHYATMTHEDGTYILGARPGEYIVQAMARGYNQAEYPTHVVVPESTIVQGINFALNAFNFGSIAGTVTDSTGAAVVGAFVEARRLGMCYSLFARSDSTGAYLLEHAIAGAYRVRAFKRGFAPGLYPDSVMVADGQHVTGINIVLGTIPPPFNGTIAGTVTDDSTNAPIGHAVVVAIGGEGRHGMYRYTFTNDDGTYLLDGLDQIPYKVFSAARGYVGEFFDNVHNFADATPVTPNASGINFALDAREMGYRSFGGYVYGSDGSTVQGAIAYAMADGQVVGITSTDPDGYYLFDAFVPGTYTVSVSSLLGDGQVDQPIDANFYDVPDADVRLEATSVGDGNAQVPNAVSLAQNYPNPFNAQTVISFTTATAGRVELDVYNMIGQKIATLVSGDYNPGTYNVIWNAGSVSSGIYYYRLKTDSQVETRKMTLLK